MWNFITFHLKYLITLYVYMLFLTIGIILFYCTTHYSCNGRENVVRKGYNQYIRLLLLTTTKYTISNNNSKRKRSLYVSLLNRIDFSF